jgi:glutamate racemase
MPTTQQAIGIFDSGLGGLTVAKAIQELLPYERIIYFGDTLHMPYGEKSKKQLIAYSEQIVQFLLSHQVKMIVIACNSASAQCASYLREHYHNKVEIQGVIRPIIDEVIKRKFKNIGIIGTQATIESGIFEEILQEKKQSIQVQSLATPKLAPMIEQNMHTAVYDEKVIDEYLSQFTNIEALLLACTHYPLIKEKVQAYYNNKVSILDNANYMAQAVHSFLLANDLLASEKQDEDQYFVSALSQNFVQAASLFFGKSINVQEENIFAT